MNSVYCILCIHAYYSYTHSQTLTIHLYTIYIYTIVGGHQYSYASIREAVYKGGRRKKGQGRGEEEKGHREEKEVRLRLG